MNVAMTVDIVGSRRLADREHAQRALDDGIARVAHDLPVAITPLRPTVGDELQGVYPSLDAALATSLLIQLALPDDIECRFGLGIGATGTVASATGPIPEGPGWWAAREAIDAVHALAKRTAPNARTQAAASADESAATRDAVRHVNAYLLARDQIVGTMSERTRTLTYGRCQGLTQSALAAQEKITQSAVSQALAAGGSAAVIEGYRLLRP
nr:SatD family protein [Microbacterium bovistercoris]